jgi:hypothetical protein
VCAYADEPKKAKDEKQTKFFIALLLPEVTGEFDLDPLTDQA